MGGDRLERIGKLTVIADANVLIDYANTNKRILGMVTGFFDRVMVPIDILNEVNELSMSEVNEFGLSVYYPENHTYYYASNTSNGLSFQDNICLFDARENNWAIISNDKKMRRECIDAGVVAIWGLEVMVMLVKVGSLTGEEAIKIAEDIHSVNKRITIGNINDFKNKLVEK